MERPAFTITGHLDGFALRYEGEVVDVFPGSLAAMAARLTAGVALADLTACLAAAPPIAKRKAS